MVTSITYRRRVPWADTDPSRAWMFTAVLRYVEEAEVELLRKAGVLDQLYQHLPRVYAQASYRRPAYFDDEVEVSLAVARIGASSLHYDFCVRRDGETAAEGRLGVVYVVDGVKAPIPPSVRQALDADATEASAGG
jgi:acyl-CoA thioester hydrolase